MTIWQKIKRYYKNLFFGPGDKWADLAAHAFGLLLLCVIAWQSYDLFVLGNAFAPASLAALITSLVGLYTARVAKDWVRGKSE